MQNQIQVFNSERFGKMRAMEINGEPWFVGKDVAAILGYRDTSDALKKHVDEEDKGVGELPTPGGMQKVITINESGLYSLILRSNLPEAKQFKRWVTSEVLPSIRKNGGYIMGQEQLTDAEILARAVLVAQNTIKQREERIKALEDNAVQLEARIEADAPRVRFAESVEASDTSILIGQLAKQFRQNGFDIGQNRLFQMLRDDGYLCKAGGKRENLPTQRAMDMGLFQIKERTHNNPDGSVMITRTTLVTGKGQVYFTNKYLGN